MGQAPQAILKLNDDLKAHSRRPQSYVFSGVVGDAAHSFGYHLSPNDISGWDYSLQLSRDKAGAKLNPDLASAWDLSFSPSDMRLVTGRLLKAAKKKDRRLRGVREFCGTLNNSQTYPWDLSSDSSEGVNSWDSSHLWHVHISFYRDTCNNYDTIKGVVDVICGVRAKAPKFPLKARQTFGTHNNRDGHGVSLLQRQLMERGFAGNVDHSWADGDYGPQTAQAVVEMKKSIGWVNHNRRVGFLFWKRLFK